MPMIKIIPLGNVKGLPEEADLVEVTKQHLVVNYQTKQRGRGGGTVDHTMNIPIDSVVYEVTAVVAPEAQDDDAPVVAPKRRGRPPKVEAEPEAPRRRGRPPKAKEPEVEEEDVEEDDIPAPAPKRRGRPPKVKDPEPEVDDEDEVVDEDDEPEPEPPRRRGRPPKARDDSAPRKRRAASVDPDDDEEFTEDFKPQRAVSVGARKRRAPEEPKIKVGAARKPFTVSDDGDDWPDDE